MVIKVVTAVRVDMISVICTKVISIFGWYYTLMDVIYTIIV